jgi:molybdopterin converting factor small subunit
LSITIVFFGPLERWAGKKEVISTGSTIYEVFKSAELQLGKSLLAHITNHSTGEIKSHFHVLLNGVDTDSKTCLTTPVNAKDTITIVPPVGGG